MRNIRIVLTAIAMVVPLAFGALADSTPQAAAEVWLGLVDRQQYEESWKQASGFFRNALTQANWVQSVKGAREPLGPLVSRAYQSSTHATTLPAAPDGEYEILQFQTSFKNKASATETVTMMRDGGEWRLAGYFIK